MKNLFKSFLFRLKKDLTFRITLFVGLGIAIFMTLIYLGIDLIAKNSAEDPASYEFMFATGQNLFLSSLSPVQNFGIAIPINLIIFTVLEFNQGTIRNKIITGNSKTKIYFNLVLSGLVFTIALILTYSLLCLALGSICGGFDIEGHVLLGFSFSYINAEFFWKMVILALLAYIMITVATIFFATLFRNIGPCIPVVILLLMFCYLSSTIFGSVRSMGADSNGSMDMILLILKLFNPIFSLTSPESELVATSTFKVSDDYFWAEVINNIVYTALFFFGGWLIFRKRDVK